MASIDSYETSAGVRYRVRYRTPEGKQTAKRGFVRKRDATEFLQELEVRKRAGEFVSHSASKITVADVHARWWARSEVLGLKASYRRRQELAWRVHVEPRWGSVAVARVSVPDLRDWIATLTARGLSASSVRSTVSVLSLIIDEAVDEGIVSTNATRAVKLPKPVPKDPAFLTHEQVRALATEVTRHSEIVWLLAYSGLRWGEMAALRPIDVDLDTARIRVARSAVKGVISTPKAGRGRTVAVPVEVAEILRPVIRSVADSSLIWSRADGSPLVPPSRPHWLLAAVDRLHAADPAFPAITAHDLRHTAASLMIAAGASVKAIQSQLGHATATMTLDRYGHLMPDDLDLLAAGMSAGFKAAAPDS
ncbi:site-specific integrase [Tsukamurella pulmonis]|uniref:tyrosine-type recombinase/integrase n=1 Tax=Tsukamurella pulmonis TaxID=47312 RepID=UPI001EDF46B2|nr:site-specific integrase [Tsukamurella pulmonis]BDD82269.1 site-specific integrase [Tsukamurella pulmonis]